MVNRINDLLEMEHRLSVWQFPSIRKYELEEMVTRIESLYQRAYGRPYKPPTVLRETAYRKRPAYRTQYDIRHREEGTQPPLRS